MLVTKRSIYSVIARRYPIYLVSNAHPRLIKFKSTATISPNASSNPQLAFPCLDRLEKKNEELTNSYACSTNDPNVNSLEAGPEPSYSKVQTGFKVFKSQKPIFFDNGGYLPEYELAYETWGELNEAKDNIILVHTGLSASSHAKSQPDNSKPGWWEGFIGSGKYLDTDKYFIICTNVIGGCYGSTGPSSKDPADNNYFGTRFPVITVNDMVRAQHELIKTVYNVSKIHASVGASMGGMQSLAYAMEFPEEVGKIVSISGCARSHPYSIALRHCQRQVLMSDPNWKRGFYYDSVPPHVGMKLAREIATVTYRSGPEWEYRFGRNRADDSKPPAFCPDFLVETYLDHAGEKFCLEYDANSLLYVSKAMDLFDLGHNGRTRAAKIRQETEKKYNEQRELSEEFSVPEEPYKETAESATTTPEESLQDLKHGMAKIAHKDILVIGVESDILFPVWQQREIADVLKHNKKGGDIRYFELGTNVSNYGHDTFLLSLDHIGPPVKDFLQSK
ncbi:Alpha/Beta hydrolase protein [Scheffersomyces coipomensis]|uniref:Alpha/Beta hydrolase protein n=1 Tax=Scheffersomyces coipomensis TaxID=1788519 RepID=UPI00315DCAF3